MLQNTTYIGKVKFANKENDGQHEPIIERNALAPTVPRPQLHNVTVGHSSNVVGHGARQALSGNLCLVIQGHQCGLGDELSKEFDDYLFSARMFLILSRRVV